MVFITNNDFMNNYISYEYFLIKLFITISFLITIFNNYFLNSYTIDNEKLQKKFAIACCSGGWGRGATGCRLHRRVRAAARTVGAGWLEPGSLIDSSAQGQVTGRKRRTHR